MTEPESNLVPRAAVIAALLAALLLCPLLIGLEPVGGDPDRIYRPIKQELASTLKQGRLPLWSDRFGLGVPLAAESHATAFYPVSWLLYSTWDVAPAYRLSMWLHVAAIAGSMAAYAAWLGLTLPGAVLAGMTLAFSSIQAIHSSHEWMYHALPYLPAALLCAEKYLSTGRTAHAAIVALLLGAQWTAGHFQIQTWTNLIVLAVGFWRVATQRLPATRLLVLSSFVLLGAGIAAVQLGLSWELASITGLSQRSLIEKSFYSFPPAHWAELAIPRLFQSLKNGPEDPYWFGQQTTGFESAFAIGILPLMLAFTGILDTRKRLWPFRVVLLISVILATMPRWWPAGYHAYLSIPLLGLFRCPARFLLLGTFALALLAGAGLDAGLKRSRFAFGIALAALFAIAAQAFAWIWIHQPAHQPSFAVLSPVARLGPAAAVWIVALPLVLAWRQGKIPAAILILFAAAELGSFYYASTTQWGWAIRLPAQSPAISWLATEKGSPLVGGVLDNLPVRASPSTSTASPYFGFALPPPNDMLLSLNDRALAEASVAYQALANHGVTHLVWDFAPRFLPEDCELGWSGFDPALDKLAYRPPNLPVKRFWHILRLKDPAPAAWVIPEKDFDPAARISSRSASAVQNRPDDSAQLLSWNANTATIQHAAPCVLIVRRTFYPGWTYRLDGGPPLAPIRAQEGLQAIPLPGSGQNQVALAFTPSRWGLLVGISLGSAIFALLLATRPWSRRIGTRSSPAA